MDLTDNFHISGNGICLITGSTREWAGVHQEMCNFYGCEAPENNIKTV